MPTHPLQPPQAFQYSSNSGFYPPYPPPPAVHAFYQNTSFSQSPMGVSSAQPRSMPPPLPPLGGPPVINGHRAYFAASPAQPMFASAATAESPRLSSYPTAHVPIPPTLPSSLPTKPALGSIDALPVPSLIKPSLTPDQLAKLKASAIISAAPVVRDLKKEATTFVPNALKRKRPVSSQSMPAKQTVKIEPAGNLPAELTKVANGLRLPPGFGGAGRAINEKGEGNGGGKTFREMQDDALPPDSSRGQPSSSLDADALQEHDHEASIASVSLPPGFESRNEDYYPSSTLEEEDQEALDEEMFPQRPGQGAGHTYSLPGMEEESDLGDVQGPAFPVQSSAYGSTLPGFDDDEDEPDLGEEQGVALPPELGSLTYGGVSVEDDD